MSKLNIFVVYGGRSAEHEVSIMSSVNILNNLSRDKYNVYPVFINGDGVWSMGELLTGAVTEEEMRIPGSGTAASSLAVFLDKLSAIGSGDDCVIYFGLHGTFGEDGTIQGLFEMAGYPYIGSGVLGSSAGMDKVVMKNVFDSCCLNQAPFVYFTSNQWTKDATSCVSAAMDEIGLPVYVKPANMGSSVGISRADSEETLKAAMADAFKYDRRILVEQEIKGREIILALRGNEDVQCSLCGEWERAADFFDFKDKYLDDSLTPRIPARITEGQYHLIKQMGVTAYKALDCAGLVRADFFVTDPDESGDGEVYINEVNTLPGFTSHSMYPTLWQRTDGTTYPELLDIMIDLARRRFDERSALTFRRAAN